MKGKITRISLVRNEQELILGYECIIEFNEEPKLHLGHVEVKQNEFNKL